MGNTTDKTHYPVIIVGGGPSGAGAGIRLQQAGMGTCIVERAIFPRQKLCGGLVTQKTRDLLLSLLSGMTEEELLRNVSAGHHNRLKLFNRMEVASDVEIGIPFELVHRRVYDHFLIRQYLESGGTLLEGEGICRLDTENKELQTSTGRVLTYDTLIAADGANSWVRNCLGMRYGKRIFCMEIHTALEDYDFDGIGIFFDLPDIVYGWVFPKKDGYCIGIGSWERPGTDYREVFRDFLRGLGVRNLERYPLKGAFVPGGGFLKKPVCGGSLLLVGDAAGFADPLTGEGLYFSLYSGIQAAEAVLAHPDSPAKDYLRRICPIQESIRSVSRIRILFRKPFYQFWLQRVGGYHDYVRYFSDHQLSQVPGSGIIGGLLKKVFSHYLRHFFRRR